MTPALKMLPAWVLILTGCANTSSPPVISPRPKPVPIAPQAVEPTAAATPAPTTLSTESLPPKAPAAPAPSALSPLIRMPLLGVQYAGRISVTIQSEPLHHLTAEVELSGDASQGELKLYGPFGALLAVLQWQPDNAVLIEGTRRRTVKNIDWLIERVTGAPLPIGLIFDWLAGRPVRNDDWLIEPRSGPQAPLRATRLQPLPRIELILALKPALAP